MDEIVKQAMAKWPNVPHCYGWLALDARGAWRMRDERAQALGLPGDKIVHAALSGFINRNYTHDDQGRWYFQNGPQRVYVNLESTPYVVRTDPTQGFALHTGESLPDINAVWLTENGQFVFECAGKIATLDDRDIAQCMTQLEMTGAPVDDDALLAWLSGASASGDLFLCQAARRLPVQRITQNAIAARFGFKPEPQPDGA